MISFILILSNSARDKYGLLVRQLIKIVALNIIFEWLLLMVLAIMMKK